MRDEASFKGAFAGSLDGRGHLYRANGRVQRMRVLVKVFSYS